MRLNLKNILAIPLLAGIMIGMQSCNTVKTIPMNELEELSKSAYSQFNKTERLVVKSDAGLQSIYDRIATKEATPQINWDRNQVVLLAMGQRNTGGFSISVDRVVYGNSEILVYYKTTGPEKGAMVTQALTAPYVLFTIENKKDLPVVFKEESEH